MKNEKDYSLQLLADLYKKQKTKKNIKKEKDYSIELLALIFITTLLIKLL